MMRSSVEPNNPNALKPEVSWAELVEESNRCRQILVEHGASFAPEDTIGLAAYEAPQKGERGSLSEQFFISHRPSLKPYVFEATTGRPINPHQQFPSPHPPSTLWPEGPSQAVDNIAVVKREDGALCLVLVEDSKTGKWRLPGGFLKSYTGGHIDPPRTTGDELLEEALEAELPEEEKIRAVIRQTPIACQVNGFGDNRADNHSWVETTAYAYKVPLELFQKMKLRKEDTEAEMEDHGGVRNAQLVPLADIVGKPEAFAFSHHYYLVMALATTV